MAMLAIQGLVKSFAGFHAIGGVDLDVEPGARHAVIGPNGAGKTTLFNLITGHLTPTEGKVAFEDKAITGLEPHRIVKLGIARSFQRVNVFPRLTVFENVQTARLVHAGLHFQLFGDGRSLCRDETRADLKQTGLESDADTLAGLLSYGKQKQLEMAIALASEPRLLLLDEPTAGMSPQETADIIALIGHITSERKLTLLFTEHDMNVVFRISDRVTVLHHGAILASGQPEDVRNNPEVQRIYLGGH